MANLKNIIDLPVVESTEGLNLIVNDNGSAKQIPANAVGAQADWAETDESNPAFIKNKPTKELMYEWNFSADDEVHEILENVDEDLTWLVTQSVEVDSEVVVSTYGMYGGEIDGEWTTVIDDSAASSCTLGFKEFHAKNEQYFHMMGHADMEPYIDIESGREYQMSSSKMEVFNKMHYNPEDGFIDVNIGGVIGVFTNDGGPIKSVKIYKVIH
jgi:hypothetical protein